MRDHLKSSESCWWFRVLGFTGYSVVGYYNKIKRREAVVTPLSLSFSFYLLNFIVLNQWDYWKSSESCYWWSLRVFRIFGLPDMLLTIMENFDRNNNLQLTSVKYRSFKVTWVVLQLLLAGYAGFCLETMDYRKFGNRIFPALYQDILQYSVSSDNRPSVGVLCTLATKL